MNKSALIEKIQNLQGLTAEERSDLLKLLREHKKYGLVWEENPEDIEERLRDELPVLREVKSRAIISNSPDAPNHILIEGDNLEALTALTYSHEGKIDVIYIDPPYNTGKNDDFTYNDKIVNEEDEYRYSKWLSFMSKRLDIAKRLLSDKGILFISIDDNSFAQLKLLCDEKFDKSSNPKNSNFVTSLIWNKQHSQQQGLFKKYHEYVLVYANKRYLHNNVLAKAEGIIEAGAMKKISKKNPASTFTFPAGVKIEAKDGTCFSGTYGDSEKVTVIDGEFVVENGVTKYPITLSAGWTQKKQMQSWFNGEDTYDTKGQKVIEFYFNSTGKIKCRKIRGAVTPNTFLPEFGMGSEQTSHLENIMGKPDSFTNPKPVEMIKIFINWFCPPNGIVLDFFAGSGTTMEATMLINEEDNGCRTCVLVQRNDNLICEQTTYERNKRVINGYTKPNGEAVEGLHNNTLRYYKTDFLPRERTQKNMRELVNAATELLCIKEDLYKEQKQFGKYRTNPRVMRYFTNGQKHMLIIYREELLFDIVEEIKNIDFGDVKLKVYVFSPGRTAFPEVFEPVQDKVTAVALPAAIYDAYQKVLPKRKAKLEELEVAKEEVNQSEEGGEA